MRAGRKAGRQKVEEKEGKVEPGKSLGQKEAV